MFVNVLLFAFLFSIFIYSIWKMARSFSGENKTELHEANIRERVFDTFILMCISCFILLGYTFDSQGVAGGKPLHIYAETGKSTAGYASLSITHVPTTFAFFILSLIAYRLLSAKMGKLPPILYVVCSSLLIANILFTLVYLTHTGFLQYGSSLDGGIAVFCIQFGYGSLSLLYIAKLNESLKQFLTLQQERNIQYTNKLLRVLSQISLHYHRVPVLGMLFLFPVIVLIQLFLVLLGQRPDSFIQVFLDTSSYNYSKMPAPPPEIVRGDGHYLCTVSAAGHKRLVKPVRSGIRHGERIVVNRQLLIANAFENIIEQYTPNLHKRIRLFYDTYGYPISKHIQTKWSADIVYLLMKPLEWLFLVVLYTVDRHPENRIHVQYSELRGVNL
ncbi:DUF6688 domain-containing protein [Sporosarcina sp. FSL K6-1508]|uniref:DUF6688 domain-containing protein n=1 Tax=Sporosarcina sp. FSL K6-1508 TaxID=2921553 RepID=UPI0030F93836